jgi:hypothetical protein
VSAECKRLGPVSGPACSCSAVCALGFPEPGYPVRLTKYEARLLIDRLGNAVTPDRIALRAKLERVL